jgi:hypothetical protein
MRAFNMHSHSRPRLNAAARLGPIMLKNCQLTGSDLTTRVAIARFRIVRARFNKRSMQAFPKTGLRSNIRNAPLPNSNIDDVCCVFLEASALPNGELSMKMPSLWMIAAVCFVAPTSATHARSAYDGSWDLAFVTQKGACDATYNFTVNVSDVSGRMRRGPRSGGGKCGSTI